MQNKIDSMKNVFFSLAFMLIGSFAFANTEIEAPTEDVNLENVINLEKACLDSDAPCVFSISWDTNEHGTGSLWIDCGVTDDGPFDWNEFVDIILANFFDIR